MRKYGATRYSHLKWAHHNYSFMERLQPLEPDYYGGWYSGGEQEDSNRSSYADCFSASKLKYCNCSSEDEIQTHMRRIADGRTADDSDNSAPSADEDDNMQGASSTAAADNTAHSRRRPRRAIYEPGMNREREERKAEVAAFEAAMDNELNSSLLAFRYPHVTSQYMRCSLNVRV